MADPMRRRRQAQLRTSKRVCQAHERADGQGTASSVRRANCGWAGRVERWRGSVGSGMSGCPGFPFVAQNRKPCSVSTSRSSNRICGRRGGKPPRRPGGGTRLPPGRAREIRHQIGVILAGETSLPVKDGPALAAVCGSKSQRAVQTDAPSLRLPDAVAASDALGRASCNHGNRIAASRRNRTRRPRRPSLGRIRGRRTANRPLRSVNGFPALSSSGPGLRRSQCPSWFSQVRADSAAFPAHHKRFDNIST